MKKFCIVLCCILMLPMLFACSNKKEELQEPVSFYYCNKDITYNSDAGVICPEVREGAAFHGNVVAFLRSYMLGPRDTNLRNPIPTDVYLVSCELNEDIVCMEFNAQFADLTGLDLTTACSAILLTIHDYTGAQTLKVSAKDAKIDDKDVFELSMDDVILIDTVSNIE